jgi:hypothetical protein
MIVSKMPKFGGLLQVRGTGDGGNIGTLHHTQQPGKTRAGPPVILA